MSAPINLIGKTRAEMKELILAAPKNAVFIVASSQVTMLQSRVANCEVTIKDYTKEILEGAVFPPGQVIFDKDTGRLYLVDGIHRAEAHTAAGHEGFAVVIRLGNEVEALLAASRSNATHGKKRNNQDKENAVKQLLLNSELCRYSNNRLAREAQVSPQLVERVRQKLEKQSGNPSVNPRQRIVERNGSRYTVTMDKASGTKKDNTPISTPGQMIRAAVKCVSKCIDKKWNDLPTDFRDAFAQELKGYIESRFSSGSNKS